MTNRERVIKAINFEKTDVIPYYVGFTTQMYQKVVDEIGTEFCENINSHIISVDLGEPEIQVKLGFWQDEYGVVWNKTGVDKDIGMPDFYQVLTSEDFEKYQFPAVNEKFVRQQCERLQSSDSNQFRIVSIGFSMFERLWTLMSIEETMCNFLINPDLIHKILDKICQRNLAMIDIALEYDFDCFHFGDDWGQQKGTMMGASHWREFIKPYVKKMYEKVKAGGRYVSQHSCGDIRDIMDDLSDMGLNIYQTYQPEIYGFDYARDHMLGKIAIWGGISTQHDLPYKTPDEIYKITKDTIEIFKETGGLIVAPTHAIPGDVPTANIIAMVKAMTEQ